MDESPEIDVVQRDRLIGLTPAQTRALFALLAGATQTEAAKAAGVHRQRVCFWVHHDVNFRVTLKKERLAALRSARAVLAAGALDAANYLRSVLKDPNIDHGHKLKAASMLLESSGIESAPTPWPVLNDTELVVSTELADIAAQHERCEHEREQLELEAALHHQFDPQHAERLSAKVVQITSEGDAIERQLRKLSSRRRLTAKQTARQDQLEHKLAELNNKYHAAENELARYTLTKDGAKDLGPLDLRLAAGPDSNATIREALRQETADDG